MGRSLHSYAWWPRLKAKAVAVGRIVRQYPSVLILPIIVMCILVGVGVWGVLHVAESEANSSKTRAQSLALDASAYYQQRLSVAIAPVMLMTAMVEYKPQYEAAKTLFNALAPALLAQVPPNTTKLIQLVPNGVIHVSYPSEGNEGAYGIDLFAELTDREGAVATARSRAVTLVGPLDFFEGGRGIIVRNPVFVRTDDPNDTFGSPDHVNPYCGEPCAYNATSRTKFWGFAACLISLDQVSAADSPLGALEARGYAYELRTPDMETGKMVPFAASAAPLGLDPVVVRVPLPNTEWVIMITPTRGWAPAWRGGLVAGVVLLSFAIAVLLFAVLVSRRQHQALLEAVLPKQMIRQMQAEDTSYLHARATGVDTPAELLLAMMRDLLEGNQPQLSDVVFIRTALLRNMDVYQPMNLKGYLRGSSLDADVVRALMRQLANPQDADMESHYGFPLSDRRDTVISNSSVHVALADGNDCSAVATTLNFVFAAGSQRRRMLPDADAPKLEIDEDAGSDTQLASLDVDADPQNLVPAANGTGSRMLDPSSTGNSRDNLAAMASPTVPRGSRMTYSVSQTRPSAVVQAEPILTLHPSVVDEVERMLAQVDSWHFNTWRLQDASQGHALSVLGFYLIQRAGLMQRHRIKPVVLARLLRQIEAGYKDNPYHNSTHAADVLQTLHVIIHSARLHVHYLDSLGLLGAYYAAMVHDYAHPGVTGDFLVATSDPLAIRYNDRSPLENHHCAASFALLQQKDLNAFEHLSKQERTTMRKQVIELVLATDMKQHFSILSHFNTVHRLTTYQQLQAGQAARASSPHREEAGDAQEPTGEESSVVAAPEPVDDIERSLSMQLALKCADIGHLGEDLSVHKAWLAVLEEEFFQQGDLERKLGIPISPLFDRSKQGVSKSQIGFYEFCGMPLVHALSTAFPGAAPLMRCFTANYQHWRNEEGKTSSRSSFVKPLPAASLAAPSNSTRAGKPPLTPATLEPTVQVVLEDAEERL